uniref:Uncharacterized protein n=1 Tax=Peronospora matthiolae TaxID=2874970 RepID=A0AAV1VE42_9STRA
MGASSSVAVVGAKRRIWTGRWCSATDYHIETNDNTTVKNLINDTIVEFYLSDAIGIGKYDHFRANNAFPHRIALYRLHPPC